MLDSSRTEDDHDREAEAAPISEPTDTDDQRAEDEPREPKTATFLKPEELAQYRQAITHLEEQQNRVAAARVAAEREQFFADAVDDRCTRLWADICANHELDPERTYKVDGTGLVYMTTTTEE